MRNLAGNTEADIYIKEELERARIPIVEVGRQNSEVPYTLAGRLGDFVLSRDWYYWRVGGLMPIETAEELYADPVGKTDIRAAGFAGGSPPREQAVMMTHDNKQVYPASREAEYQDSLVRFGFEDHGNYIFTDDPESVGGKLYVPSYHIDSEVGLRIFADVVHSLLAANNQAVAD